MKKIVLIEPAASEANVYSKLHMPLLGPVYLGTILKNAGHQVEIYNEDIYRPDYSKLDADIIGISVLTSTAKRGYDIARKFPKEKVIIGGVHASLLPEEALGFSRQVVVGEAEEVIVPMIDGLIKDPIVHGKAIRDLDSLPFPDFSLIKGYRPNFSLTPISTSRGCPFDCTFCSVTKVFGKEFRFRSAESVMQELALRSSGPLFFCDDNFTANRQRAHKLLKLMLQKKIPSWSCQVRCDAARDEELLDLMSKAGCDVVCIGFESVNAKTLRSYKKGQTIDDMVKAIGSFHKKKIKIHGMFVLGGEDDDETTVWDTLKFAIKQKIDTLQMSVLTPFPGTRIHDDYKSQKRIFTYDWGLYDGQHVIFEPKLLSPKDLQLTVAKAYTKFYSLRNSFILFLKMQFRNAIFRFMGHRIVRQWIQQNRQMQWLSQ